MDDNHGGKKVKLNPILLLLAVVCTVLAYAAGVVTGLLIYVCERRVMRRLPASPCPDADPVRQLRIEEDRKAFADCMSYSAERAYERNQP